MLKHLNYLLISIAIQSLTLSIVRDNYASADALYKYQYATENLMNSRLHYGTELQLANQTTLSCNLSSWDVLNIPQYRDLGKFFTYIDKCRPSQTHFENFTISSNYTMLGHNNMIFFNECREHFEPRFEWLTRFVNKLLISSLTITSIFAAAYIVIKIVGRKCYTFSKTIKIIIQALYFGIIYKMIKNESNKSDDTDNLNVTINSNESNAPSKLIRLYICSLVMIAIYIAMHVSSIGLVIDTYINGVFANNIKNIHLGKHLLHILVIQLISLYAMLAMVAKPIFSQYSSDK